MQTCQVCQKQNPAGAEYCEDCGASLRAASNASAASASPQAVGTPASRQSGGDAAPGGPGAAGELGLDTPPSAPPIPASPPPTPEPGPSVATDGAAPSVPARSGPNPRLAVKRFGALTSEEIPLMGERVVVGRFDPETGPVDLDLSSAPEAQHISRHHGELYREADGRWFVRDLGSTNGVFVKGAADAVFGPRITTPRAIVSGDELAFGNARFVFQTD